MKNLRNLFLIFAVSLPLALTAQLSQFYDEGLKGYHFGETDEIPIAAFFQTYQEDLGLTDLDEMIVFQEETDELAQKHIKYSQRYNGLDVENTIFALHTQNESENLALAHGCIVGGLSLETSPSISESTALHNAMVYLGAEEYAWQNNDWENNIKELNEDSSATYYPSVRLLIACNSPIYSPNAQDYFVAYKFQIQASSPIFQKAVYVDAHTGQVIRATDEASSLISKTQSITPLVPKTDDCDGENQVSKINPGTKNCDIWNNAAVETSFDGFQSFNCKKKQILFMDWAMLKDCSRNFSSGFNLMDGNGFWPSSDNANGNAQAFWALGKTYDYYKSAFNRNGIDNNFREVILILDPSNPIVFQFSEPSIQNGSSVSLKPDFVTPDIVGHETTHGIFRSAMNTTGIATATQNGALEEGWCDVFGEMVERYIRGSADFVSFNELTSSSFTLLKRNLADPQNSGTPKPDTYNSTLWDNSADNHDRGTVASKWFVLLANGGTQNNISVSSIGADNAMKILYRTINLYFQQNQSFYTARNFTIQAATDLYGLCSQEVKQVTNAWEAVGVLGGTYNISPCVNFIGFIKKGICSSSVVTYKVNSNLDGNVSYTWSSNPPGASITQNGNQATITNFPISSNTQILVQAATTNPSVAVTANIILNVGSCRMAQNNGGIELEAFTIYPNPANNSLTLYFPNENETYSWEITNLQGQSVLVGKGSRHEKEITVADLAIGVYVMSVRVGNEIFHRKIEIMR